MAVSPAPVLNARQQHYLLAAYDLDQAAEQEQQQVYLRDAYSVRRPAAEWRWLPYGRWLHLPGQPPTLLRQALDKTLISPGTGSTWKALASRRLLTVENQLIHLPGMRAGESYYLPHVRLTTAGRRLARQLKGEVRTKKPVGLLSETTWQALVKLWQRDPNSEGGDAARQLDIYWPVWQRVKWLCPRQVLGRRNHEPLVDSRDYLTTAGRIYYYEHWAVNHQAYPHLLAPDLTQSPELAGRVAQLSQEAAAGATGPPDDVYQQWCYSLRVLRHATYLGRQQREMELARGLPATPAELAGRPELKASWRQFRRDYWLHQHLSPAEWNCCQLWQVVQLDAAGCLSWRHRPPLTWAVRYDAQAGTLHLSLMGLPDEMLLVTALTEARAEAFRQQCGRWLLNLRGLEKPLPVAAQRAVLNFLHRTGREADLYWQLRVALAGAQPPLAHWQTEAPSTT